MKNEKRQKEKQTIRCSCPRAPTRSRDLVSQPQYRTPWHQKRWTTPELLTRPRPRRRRRLPIPNTHTTPTLTPATRTPTAPTTNPPRPQPRTRPPRLPARHLITAPFLAPCRPSLRSTTLTRRTNTTVPRRVALAMRVSRDITSPPASRRSRRPQPRRQRRLLRQRPGRRRGSTSGSIPSATRRSGRSLLRFFFISDFIKFCSHLGNLG